MCFPVFAWCFARFILKGLSKNERVPLQEDEYDQDHEPQRDEQGADNVFNPGAYGQGGIQRCV